MKISEFKTLKKLFAGSPILLTKNCDYATLLIEANIPYKPGVYLVYSVNENFEDQDLLYFGKAGVTHFGGVPKLNFHQLPARLVAAAIRPLDYSFSKQKFVSRSKLWPWYVENKYHNGMRIYWFITEWPALNPIEIEREIKKVLKDFNPLWKKKL